MAHVTSSDPATAPKFGTCTSMSSLDENLNRSILVNLVCGHGARTIKIISKLLFSIWKEIDLQGFLGVDVSQKGKGVSKKRLKDISQEKN